MKIFIKVKTGAHKDEVEKLDDNEYKVSVKERPVRGKANEAVIKSLATHFKVPRSAVIIKAGHTSKSKIVDISPLTT